MKLLSSKTNPFCLNIASLVLRVFVGISMMTHGYPKLEKLMANGDIEFFDFLGLGAIITMVLVVFAEVVCSALIILGLFTRLASSILIITMLVAIFVVHAGEGYSGKELAAMYLFYYIILIGLGPGRFSLDQLFSKKEIRY